MPTFFVIFIIIVLIQRLMEMIIARRNEKWMINHGGIEYRKVSYKWLISLQIGFFLSFFVELLYKQFQFPQLNIVLLLIFMIIQIFRVWSIYTLGRFWRMKTIVLPKIILLRKGIYKYVKDPYQFIISIELIVIPLMFGAYLTAIIFPISYIISLTMRTPIVQKNKLLLEKL